ncbi:MAG: succinate dehydrogenase assembly factor 2 [Porticoccus sp.]|jgi:antitoxin CptB|uniref:FAD assembly factor SdhE n=1 Tax=Porticoccus sp. Uisw_050_02 TaxID=3230978 RepID=UPI001D9BB42F|nr:succinate dehydrogenase assembly factor 2 [Porticoccus sp.]|tara:strand:+ start:92 stop:349 length:258 start_codon:yes stop_codon:yes gene_type:complete
MNINRLSWASRRGMLELDLMLLPFLEKIYPTLDLDDQKRYWKLLECEDQDLWSWLLKSKVSDDPDLQKIIGIIRNTRALTRPDIA